MGDGVIELKKITKIYKGKRKVKTVALDDVSFTLPDKGFVFILGKSGCGKSTLLHLLGGLDKPTSGEIIVNGKSTKKFRNKDFDYYRNTYVGFIFQDFNLLEEYSLYDNVSLALRLQRKKVDHEKISQLLEQLELNGLEKRKMNELSGGQKQRVAIARAMIKDPEILLADEPTGSLDETTGKQIFEQLKRISEEKLVVVVTHDREAAMTYADSIIELKDGKVISNNLSNSINSTRTFVAKKSKLPFSFALKMAFRNLGSKKVRLFFTIFLLFCALSFFGIAELFSNCDTSYVYADVMASEKENDFFVYKGEYNEQLGKYILEQTPLLTEQDKKETNDSFEQTLYPVYQINENNMYVSFQFDNEKSNEQTPYYYHHSLYYVNFIPVDKKDFKKELWGRYPEKADEIVVHQYFAEQMIYHGILLYNENTSIDQKPVYYKPNSIEQTLEDGMYLKLGSNKVKIVGIIKDDLKEYELLKETPYKTLNQEMTTSLFGVSEDPYQTKKFSKKIQLPASNVYVSKKFVDEIKWIPNQKVDMNNYQLDAIFSDSRSYLSAEQVGYLDHSVKAYNGQEEVMIDTLNSNEILVPESYLNDITNGTLDQQQEEYINQYQQLLKNNPDTVEYKTNEELKKEFLLKYISDNHIIGSSVKIRFFDHMSVPSRIRNIGNVIIKGVIFDTSGEYYFGNGTLDDLLKDNYMVPSLYGTETNFDRFYQLFDRHTGKDPYIATTIFTDDMNVIQGMVENLGLIFLYASLIFGCFALLLLINFIINSIYYEKKKIGILRALGARSNDVFKIFLYEGFIIAFLSLIFVFITLFLFKDYVNQEVTEYFFFSINILQVYPTIIIRLLLMVFAVVFVASLFTVNTITRMKPVDVILNRKQ